MITILEPMFDILVTHDRKVMLVILARPDMQENPFLVYDFRHTMALFRDKHEIIKLTEIPHATRKILQNTPEILVTEMDEESHPTRQYSVKIFYDSRLKKKLKKEKQILY